MNRYRLIATRFSQITQPATVPGGPVGYTRHRKGDVIELDDVEAERLLKANAVVPLDDEGQGDAVGVEGDGEGEAFIPLQGRSGEGDAEGGAVDSTDISSGPKGAVPPKAGAKPLWVDYAVANGMTRAAAEEMSKADLIAKYGGN